MKLIENGEITNPYRSFIAKSRYSRWIDEYGRRETWAETVDRYVDFFTRKADLTPDEKAHLRYNILNHKVMPSMRALMTAGEALERSNVAGYNCSFVAIDDLRAFDEALYILMCGTGLGFSAESKYVSQLPVVPETFERTDDVIVVDDSKEGWAQAFRELLATLFRGELPRWDLRRLRPEGARLKTFGGRSSGPAPLNELFEFTVRTVVWAAGRQLRPIEAHDIMCMIGSIVVVGGVRRSALISLGDLEDDDMRHAKDAGFREQFAHRDLSNNSAVYYEKPEREVFDAEWDALVASHSGERGIFNLAGGRKHAPERRNVDLIAGTNPCAEILLRNMGFCNLTEVVVRPDDTLEDLKAKVALATKIGTWQSTLTNFPYLREQWRINAEEERLLGVSLTGIMDHSVLNGRDGKNKQISWLKSLKQVAIRTNAREAARLGINPSAAITTVKPSGTVSQLTDSASGIHPRYAPYYVRTVRGANMDPLTQFMKDAGIPSEPCVRQPEKTTVFSFPVAAPEGGIVTSDLTAIEQLEQWLVVKTHWTEHSPSVTINVRDHEWEEVGNWVYDHFDTITGISFLPYEDHVYEQAPYQAVTKEAYEALTAEMPETVRWEFLSAYELEDTTSGSQTLACQAGYCEVVDVVSAK